MSACGTPHPESPEIVCDKEVPCTGYHADAATRTVWGVTDFPLPAPKPKRRRGDGRTRAELAQIAQRAQ